MESGQIDNNNTGAGAGGAVVGSSELDRLTSKDWLDFGSGILKTIADTLSAVFRKTPDKIEINTGGSGKEAGNVMKYLVWALLGLIFLFVGGLVVRSLMKSNNNSNK